MSRFLLGGAVAVTAICMNAPAIAEPGKDQPATQPVTRHVLSAESTRHSVSSLTDDEHGPYLRVTAKRGERVRLNLKANPHFEVKPLHLYRLDYLVNRQPRIHLNLRLGFTDRDGQPVTYPHSAFPRADQLTAPIWQTMQQFLVVPADAARLQLDLQVHLRNTQDGPGTGHVDLGPVMLTDLGPMRELPQAERITHVDQWEIDPELTRRPRAPSSGAGVYRVRATARASEPTRLRLMLAQGHDPRLHWHRSSEYGLVTDLEAGQQDVEWLFYVGDRRFVHQWLRAKTQTDEGATVTLTGLVLEKIMASPPR